METTTEAPPAPRIAPGSARELGRVNTLITRALGAAVGGTPPHVFTTLARHRRLFRRWLPFAGALMPGGLLPRAESELVILRVAHNCDSDYERRSPRAPRRRGRPLRRGDRARRTRSPPPRAGPSASGCSCGPPTSCTPSGPSPNALWAELAATLERPGADRALHARRPLRDARHDAERAARAARSAARAAHPRGLARVARQADRRRSSMSAADLARRAPGGDHRRRAGNRRPHRAGGCTSAARASPCSAWSPTSLPRRPPPAATRPGLSATSPIASRWTPRSRRPSSALGGLDVAIANAGIGAQMTLIDGDPSVWDAQIAVNLNGTYNLVRAAGPARQPPPRATSCSPPRSPPPCTCR